MLTAIISVWVLLQSENGGRGMRLIDADKLKAEGYALHRLYQKDPDTIVSEVKNIDDVPTVEAEPIRHGQWIPVKGYEGLLYRCSACDSFWSHTTIRAAYCKECGAKMENKE